MSAAASPAIAMPPERRFPVTLLLFGAVSLLAHAATFFLFQVGYPSHVTLPAQTPQVFLVTGEAPDQQALMRWIESEDPALIAASSHPVPPGLFETPYRPSYMTPRTAPRTVPALKETPERAPSPELSTLLRSVLPVGAGAPSKVERARTQILLSGGLTGRALAQTPALKTAVRSPLEELSVLLGVTPEGEVRFTFLQHSSGDHPTDAAALARLAAARFQPADSAGELAWGFADIIWGDDAYPAAAR